MIAADLEAVHRSITAYYSDRVQRFGATPAGVDWTCIASQQMRFVQLMKVCGAAPAFSLNDVGCGHGALLELLDDRYSSSAIDYLGVDLSAAMIRRARSRWRGHPNARFVVGDVAPRVADYAVASGLFNVQQDHPVAEWELFVQATLEGLAATSRRGFAVNFMASMGPAHRPGLYTTGAQQWTIFCRERFGATVETVGGYGLPEFTLVVRLAPGS